VVVLAIGSATISYFVVEKPALRLKNSIAWCAGPAVRPHRRPRSLRSSTPRVATSFLCRSDVGGVSAG